MNAALVMCAAVALGPQPADTLHLSALQTLAIAEDTRTARLELEREASGLRAENLKVARLPQIQMRGDASYQSEVIDIPIDNPAFSVPSPPKERYEVALETDWMVWDGGLVDAQRAVENAQLASTLAGLDAEIFGVRMEVANSFFSALLLQEQVHEVEVLIGDLETRLEEMRVRVDQGAALPGDTASMRAELLVARQQRDAIGNERRVALSDLSRLIGRPIDDAEVLALPDLSAQMAAQPLGAVASDTISTLPLNMRTHPQFGAFEAARKSRDMQVQAIRVTARPSVSVFGQFSLGTPGFDQFNDSLHEYWRAGARVRWAPWNWDRRDREVQEVQVQQRLIDNQEQRFSDQLFRLLQRPMRVMEYLRTALGSDDEIIALREQAEEFARIQFEERAISGSAYTRARSDLQEARIARLRHRAELVRAQAQYLITLGVEF